ncbi:MAG: sodium:calcium antiporter [Alphaproteobacteria bacterium RIFCSPHIGHO2_12_FULL_63_12]|nr:MAG: sodium:calcium antiporter [Alphaproteobacteria bacterium RIFCSPHIGHO2_12_FULL_63_12]
MDWLSIAGGLVILTLGAEILIRGATALARRFGVSDLLIGLTLVGFGTSTPELVSSVQAALIGSPGVAVGNVVGSNIANILLILGLSAFIAPFAVEQRAFRRDGFVVLVATMAIIAVSMTGEFGRIAGAAFLASIVAYIIYAFVTERRAPDHPAAEHHAAEGAALPAGPKSPLLDCLMAIAGLALLIVGAKFLVTGAINVAGALGVSETIIGLTVVAIGTSLPELVTSVMAAVRGKSSLALGNVVGSNIYNSFGILGVTATIHPVAAPAEIVAFDNWVMLGATVLMIIFAMSRSRISRLEGAAMVTAYLCYVGWLVLNA